MVKFSLTVGNVCDKEECGINRYCDTYSISRLLGNLTNLQVTKHGMSVPNCELHFLLQLQFLSFFSYSSIVSCLFLQIGPLKKNIGPA